ncbi:MAG TPA: ligase [Rubrivivax sp.]|nr:ligase [Rubrivivax sp.]
MSGAPSVAWLEQQWNERQLRASPRRAAWRLWLYDAPAVVLGCSQPRLAAGARGDLQLLLRRSGGGAVLAGPWMLGLSVALPSGHALVSASAVESYRWLGELLGQWLRDSGIRRARAVPAGAAPVRPAAPELDWACFASLSPWEIAAGEGKIAGLAQVRRRELILLVAGILLAPPDWLLLTSSLAKPPQHAAALTERSTSWAQQSGANPDREAVAGALGRQLAERLGGLRG